MPRRRKSLIAYTNSQPPTAEDPNWWLEFLAHKGLLHQTTAAGSHILVVEPEVEQALQDPMFQKFLEYGPGKTGGPATVADFLRLPLDQKKFYIEVFKNWKKVIREKKVNLELL
ncbi:MAG: hypothetical protein QXH03_02815 [Candidatus Bathyarchaeia archaeon]